MKSTRRYSSLLVCLSLATSHWPLATARAADWPQFRGPGSLGTSEEKNLPVKWSAKEGLRWVADLPGRGLSSPVVAGNRVFVTATTGYQQSRLHVLCFDLASGKKLWERQFWSTGSTTCHPKTSMAAPTPVTDGKNVYALFATCDLVCLDMDGNLVWLRSLAGDYPTVTNQVGMAASPTIWKDTLLVLLENAGESFAAGIDTATGKNKWKVERKRQINWTTPIVIQNGNDAEVLFLNGSELAAYDPATGKKRWSYDGGGSTTPSAVPGKGMVLVPGSELVALKPPAGKGEPEVLWSSTPLRPATASPVYHDGRVYTVTGAGVLNCGDAASGKVLWQQRLKGPFSASPVVADGKLYAVNEAGICHVVQLGDKPEVLAANDVGDTILATPAISGGAILLRSDGKLWCVGEKK